jgi:hypothetical protein
VRGCDRGNRNRGDERGEREDERPLPALSLRRETSRRALVDSLLDAIDEGLDHITAMVVVWIGIVLLNAVYNR